jgi:hypothetical protein
MPLYAVFYTGFSTVLPRFYQGFTLLQLLENFVAESVDNPRFIPV